jgi:MoaA/NifB/PqqE/SkfB family radical SAM enzyme
LGRIIKEKEREKEIKDFKRFMIKLFENLRNRSEYHTRIACRKCMKRGACFPEGYMYAPKEIENCKRLPEIVKIWYQAKTLGIILFEYPLTIDYEKLKELVC